MQKVIANTPNVTVIETMGKDLLVENNVCKGVIDENGNTHLAKAVILTTGTYLNGKILVGHTAKNEGPDGQRAATGFAGNG